MAVKAIPEGYHSVTPYLYVKGAAAALEFWKTALGAVETVRMAGPDGSIMHGEMKIGDSLLMFAEENDAWGNKSPTTLGGPSGGFCIYLENVDEAFARAVEAGATVKMPVADQFYGDRSGTVVDPFGHVWTLATHTEDLTPEQMEQRMADFMKSMPKA